MSELPARRSPVSWGIKSVRSPASGRGDVQSNQAHLGKWVVVVSPLLGHIGPNRRFHAWPRPCPFLKTPIAASGVVRNGNRDDAAQMAASAGFGGHSQREVAPRLGPLSVCVLTALELEAGAGHEGGGVAGEVTAVSQPPL